MPFDRQTIALAAALFALLFSVYGLSYSGAFTADDEQHLAAGAQTFALTGDLDAMQLYGNPRLQGGFHNVDPALPVIASVVYRVVARTGLGSVQAMFWLTPMWVALTGVAIFLIGRMWGYASTLAVWPSLLCGLGSMAWPYAKTFFRDPLAMLFVSVAWLCFEAALRDSVSFKQQLFWWLALLTALAGGILTKNIVIPLVPVLAVAAFLRSWRLRLSNPLSTGTRYALVAAFLLVSLALLARPESTLLFRSSGAYFVWLANWLTAIPHTGFWPAVWGALASPGKGIIFYAPFTLLVILAWFVAWRSAWGRLLGPLLWLITMVVAQAFVYDYRWANSQWGARFLLPALPGLAVSILPGLEWLRSRSSRVASATAVATLGVGLLTQLPGVLIPPPAYSTVVLQIDRRAFFDLAIWNPAYSQIVGHWRLVFAGQPWDIALLRVFPYNPFGVTLLTIGLGIALWIAIAILQWLPFRSTSSDLSGLTEYSSVQRFLLRPDRSVSSALGLVLVAPVASLAVLQSDPAYSGHISACRATVEFLNANIAADDLIVVRGYLDPFWYCYFNFGRPRGVWAGLPTFDGAANDAPPGDPFYLPGLDADVADQTLFTEAATRYHRLWVVVDPAMPMGTEGFDLLAWLRDRSLRVREWIINDGYPFRIIEFELS